MHNSSYVEEIHAYEKTIISKKIHVSAFYSFPSITRYHRSNARNHAHQRFHQRFLQ